MSGIIGQPLCRLDGPLKVSGKARYAAEFAPEGLCYAALIESTISAGTITRVDTSAAMKAPGVLFVLTSANAMRLPYLQAAQRPAVEPVSGERLHVFQSNEILFCG